MEDFRAVEAVKFCRRSRRVCAYVTSEEVIAYFEVAGEVFGEGNLVKAVAGRPYNGADLLYACFERSEIWEPVVVNNA